MPAAARRQQAGTKPRTPPNHLHRAAVFRGQAIAGAAARQAGHLRQVPSATARRPPLLSFPCAWAMPNAPMPSVTQLWQSEIAHQSGPASHLAAIALGRLGRRSARSAPPLEIHSRNRKRRVSSGGGWPAPLARSAGRPVEAVLQLILDFVRPDRQAERINRGLLAPMARNVMPPPRR